MFKKKNLIKLMSFWPPLFGAGITVDNIEKDFSKIEVSMRLRFWNKNYVNTHYGGSLYSMTDPFIMLMLIERLGPGFIVWDKAASINFKKPGVGRVHATFHVSDEILESIKKDLETKEKIYPIFTIQVIDEAGDVVCSVDKTLYIKRK
jgi:hypothetical protein